MSVHDIEVVLVDDGSQAGQRPTISERRKFADQVRNRMEPNLRWQVISQVLGSDGHVYVETAIQLPGDRVHEVPLGASDAVSGLDVQHPKRHRRPT